MRFPAFPRQAGNMKIALIVFGLAVLAAGTFGFAQAMRSQAHVPTRAAAPAAVDVPPDIAAFLRQVGEAYGSENFSELPRYLASDFLYQGMRKEVFLDHLKREQKYLGKLTIVPIAFKAEGEVATVVAYAISPRGVVAPSMQLVPLNIGANLIKQDGAWKLRGNQRPMEAALYRELASLTADFPPADMETYKRLVPAGYTAPKEPLVRVSVSNWLDMEPPQTPYRLVSLNILVRKNEENFWYIVSMPETDWVAVKAGNVVGFPKFVTDIDIERSLVNRWKVAVRERGQALLSVSFEPDSDARSRIARQVDSWLLIDKDKTEIRAWMTPLNEAQSFSQKFGWMTIDPVASPWKELVAPGSKAAATTLDLTEGLKLNMTPLLHQGENAGG